MQCLVSVDGLSLDDLSVLCALLPTLKKFVEDGGSHVLDSHLLTQPQPIWAEILTGKAWYENGCAGYARPTESLNKLDVVSDKNLLTPTPLLASTDGKRIVTVNIPLVRPEPSTRLWLSDGGLPLNKQVSPPALLKEPPVSEYQARPFKDIGKASGTPSASAQSAIEVERQRIGSALHLLRNFDCGRFILRLTLFDHLSHLLGLNFLSASSLSIWAELREFCSYLDSALSEILSLSDGNAVVLSAYSHVVCKNALSLNNVLEQAGLLQTTNLLDATQQHRLNAANAALGYELGGLILSSYEGLIDEHETTAASVSYGGVYLNRSEVFKNGSVTPASYDEKRAKVRALLQTTLSSSFGGRFHIEEAPVSNMKIPAPIPEFIINIDGVEFHNMRDVSQRDYDVPRTTHCPTGFLIASKGTLTKDEKVRPTEITELFE